MSKAPSISDMLSVAASAGRSMLRKALSLAFSPEDTNSRPNEGQLEILKGIKDYLIRIVKAGNQSGKSRTAARDLTWFLNREHPFIDVNAEWPNQPLLALVAGADRSILTNNLWELMIKPLLSDPSDWKPTNTNDGIKSAMNKKTGDQIIFITHNKGSDEDIRHLMSYAAHYVWIDEIPKTTKVIEELTRRIDAKRGRLILSYTMKSRNDSMRKSIAKMDPAVTKLYRLAKLDNPIYADRKAEELAKISHLSKEEQAVILYGDDILSDTQIHPLNRDTHVGLPPNYNYGWPHVVVVDPATESKLGLLVAAHCAPTNQWWIVKAEYVEGLYAPSKIVAEVENRVKGLNIVKRVYDTAASWYKREAKELGFEYKPIKEKANSKEGWIMAVNQALGKDWMIAEWCEDLMDEMDNYQRVPGSVAIQNPKKYHLIDALHYFSATVPKIVAPAKPVDYWQHIHDGNEAYKQQQRAKALAHLRGSRPKPLPRTIVTKKYSSWR